MRYTTKGTLFVLFGNKNAGTPPLDKKSNLLSKIGKVDISIVT